MNVFHLPDDDLVSPTSFSEGVCKISECSRCPRSRSLVVSAECGRVNTGHRADRWKDCHLLKPSAKPMKAKGR
jgi:hypothetical protein